MTKHLSLIGATFALALTGSMAIADTGCTEETRDGLRMLIGSLIENGTITEDDAQNTSMEIAAEMGLSLTEAPALDDQCTVFKETLTQLGQEDAIAEFLGEE